MPQVPPTVYKVIGRALGKLIRNLRNPVWIAAAGTSYGINKFVVSPLGTKSKASLKKHLHHGDDQMHIADLYEDAAGNEYLFTDDEFYYYNHTTDEWYLVEEA